MVFHTMMVELNGIPHHGGARTFRAPARKHLCRCPDPEATLPPVLITTLSVEQSTPSDSFPPSLCARTQDVYGEEA